ncbi:MAG: cytochrome c oxidase subunit 3 [Bdellovibrionales bacterium]|nr:cytochrome c oxidase subunit 3 [Bdellovibrionales bacterium]
MHGAAFLDWKMGAINTVVLLFSSFTMVLGVRAAQTNNSKLAGKYLLVTLICGGIFMFIKYLEYSHKFHMGIFPGELLTYEGAKSPQLGLYFSFYFLMTGLHGSHVLIGMGLLFWLYLRARKNEFNANYYTPVEGVGLFWHLVDVIWIYLFPLLYLIGRHS